MRDSPAKLCGDDGKGLMNTNASDSTILADELLTDSESLEREVRNVVATTRVVDVHTHVFPPEFGAMCLSGIDDLLTYHYLIAETFRSSKISYACFWKMNKAERADTVWQTLFVDNTPLSEAARGIVSILEALGLNSHAASLDEARSFFRSRDLKQHFDWVLE